MTASYAKKILVVRNDKIGDFMLAYPAFALLKNSLPEARIYALVPAYTADMAEACPWIDEVIIDPVDQQGKPALFKLLTLFRSYHFDAMIALYSTTRVALCAFLAGIPYRLAPATKLAQFFYTNRLKQRRSRSEKPEHAYNSDLVKYFCADIGVAIAPEPELPLLQFDAEHVASLRQQFCQQHHLDPQQLLIFVHPGSGGSARNLSTRQYAQLAAALKSATGHTIIISAGPGEFENAHRLAKSLPDTPHVVFESHGGLRRFAEMIQFADVFIAGSTGPIHIAGALNRPTVAFYPRRRSATALRWQTLNHTTHRLAFSPPAEADEEDMERIDIDMVAATINEKYLR